MNGFFKKIYNMLIKTIKKHDYKIDKNLWENFVRKFILLMNTNYLKLFLMKFVQKYHFL